ncbi:transglycosylase [Gemmatimonadetes bacterium T265]|nr:transglycosylase [Gemmatimonadetes bacterium T265]
MDLLWWLIVGVVAGYLTGKLMQGAGYGPLMDVVVGVIGAFIGGFVMRSLGFAGQGGLLYTILVAVLGAVLLTLLVRLVTGGRRQQL